MATMSFSSPATQATDAEYTDRINELFSIFETLLVYVPQSGDMTYPVVSATRTLNTITGWRVYRFNDPLQATAPVFIKVEVGCGNVASVIHIFTTVGSGADGSGNITGTNTSRQSLHNSNGTGPNAGTWPSYACATSDGFWFTFKSGSIGTPLRAIGACAVFRSCDSSGTPTGTSVTWVRTTPATNSTNSAGFMRTIRYEAPGGLYDASSNYSISPGTGSSSGGLGGDIEVYLCYYLDPKTNPTNYIAGLYSAEFPTGTVFTATLVGSIPRTYISMGVTCGAASNRAGGGTAFLWE